MDEQYRRASKLGILAFLESFEREDEAKAFVDGYEQAMRDALARIIPIIDDMQARL